MNDVCGPDKGMIEERAAPRQHRVLQAQRIVSVNKRKQTVAYRPLASERERDAIDEILIDAAKLPKRFNQTLRFFVKDAVVIDDTDARRSHLKSLFDAPFRASACISTTGKRSTC